MADVLFPKGIGGNNNFYRKIFWDTMNEREKSGFKRGDLIDFLLEMKNSKQESSFRKLELFIQRGCNNILHSLYELIIKN